MNEIFAYNTGKDLIIGVRGKSEYTIKDFNFKLIQQRKDIAMVKMSKEEKLQFMLTWAIEESQCVEFEEIQNLLQ